jgi:hypothetical protein
MYSVLKPCKTSAAFEAIPRERFSLDLDRSEEILKKVCTIVTNAGILLIVMTGARSRSIRTGGSSSRRIHRKLLPSRPGVSPDGWKGHLLYGNTVIPGDKTRHWGPGGLKRPGIGYPQIHQRC